MMGSDVYQSAQRANSQRVKHTIVIKLGGSMVKRSKARRMFRSNFSFSTIQRMATIISKGLELHCYPE